MSPQPNPPIAHDSPALRLQHASAINTEIWGQPHDADDLLRRLTRAGFAPATAPATPNHSPAPTPHRVFVATPDTTPATVFARMLSTLRSQASPQQQPPPTLLHPVARTAWFDLPDTGRFAVTGYSGHGNMLVQSLLRKLDEHALGPDPQRRRPAWINRLRRDADQHGHILRAASESLLQRIAHAAETDLRDYAVAPHQFDNCEIRALFTDHRVVHLRKIPYAGFLAADFGSHAPWDHTAQRFAQRFGYRRVYAVVRDPLAGLASNAAKTARPHEAVLHRADWFAQCARESADYLHALHASRSHVRLIRFEDLLQEPIAHLQRFAHDAGYSLTDTEAQAIWNDVGFQPITRAGAEHLVDPLADKRRHFRKAHLPLLEAAGLMPCFEHFGYHTPTPDDLPDGPLQPPPATSTPNPLYGRPDPTTLHRATSDADGLDILASETSLAQLAVQLAHQDAFRAAADSLGQGLLREAFACR